MAAIGSSKRKDIRFKRSFIRFVILALVWMVLALTTQFFLRQVGLKQSLNQLLKEDQNYRVLIHEPSFQFKQGWWPVVGVHLARVELYDKTCAEKNALFQGVLLPFQWDSLFSGAPRVGTAVVDFLDVHLRPCPQFEKALSKKAARKGQKKIGLQEKSKKQKTPNSLPWEEIDQSLQKLTNRKWAEQLRGIHIKRAQLMYKNSSEQVVRLEGQGSLSADKSIELSIDLSQLRFGDEVVPISKGEIKVELTPQSLLLSLEARVREGLLTLKLDWPIEAKQEVSLQASVQKIPLSYLSSFYLKDNQLSYLWLDCGGVLASPKDKILKTPINISSCLTDGPYGQIRFENIQYTLDQGLESLDIEINKLDLDQILRNKREAYLSGVLSKYGILTQKIQYRSGVIETEGFLENTEVLFSRRNRRDLQKIKKLSYQAKGETQAWQARLKSMELENGEFLGDLKMQKKLGSEKIDGQLSVHRLVLEKKIYELLLQSEVAVLTLYGQFQIAGEKVVNWSALGATPMLKSKDYQIENLKIKATGQQGSSTEISLSVAKGSVNGSSELVAWLLPTTLDSTWVKDSLGFKELSVRLNLKESKSVQWQRGYVRLEGGWQLSTEGDWTRERVNQAWLQWDRPDGRFLRWNFQGSLFDGVWFPQTQWVKEWLVANQSFLKKNKQISFEIEGS